jgi:hypothetical protein
MKNFVFFSYDHTIVEPSQDQYRSFGATFKEIAFEYDKFVDWEHLLKEYFATTENNLTQKLYGFLNDQTITRKQFACKFFKTRSLWFRDIKEKKFDKQDMIYPDSLEFLFKLYTDGSADLGLICFDSEQVIQERIPDCLKRFFVRKGSKELFGSFGNTSFSREQQLEEQILSISKHDIRYEKERYDNIYFVCSNKSDFKNAISKDLKVIYLASRDRYEFDELFFSPEIRYILKQSEGRAIVTNRLDDIKILDFIKFGRF